MRRFIPVLALVAAGCSDLITLPVDPVIEAPAATTDGPARQAPPTACLPSVRSFSARSVTPRLNRLSWSLPGQITGCEYTGFEMDFQRPHDDGTFVQVSDTATVFLHGSEDTCFGPSCSSLTEADSVMSYKIRTMAHGTSVPGPWSREVTVRRSTTYNPTAPIGFSLIHQDSGHAKMYWSPPVFPPDTAGVTYDIQHRAGSGRWRSLPSVAGDTARVSFVDLPPVGVSMPHKFRIRTVHDRKRSAWAEADSEIVTFDRPEPFSVKLNRSNARCDPSGAGSSTCSGIMEGVIFRDTTKVELIITPLTVADVNRRRSLHYTWEVSEGNRYSYPAPTGEWHKSCRTGFSYHPRWWPCVRFPRNELTPGVTYWVRITAWHGTISGADYEIDVTLAADTRPEVPGNEYDPPDPPRTHPNTCGPSNEFCERPYAPDSEATYGPGYLTVAWTTTQRESYSPGTNPDGSPARVTRVEMRYEACPMAWSGARKRMERVGPASNCRSGNRKASGSRGTITYRPSFRDIGGKPVDVWDVMTFAKAINSRGRVSPEEGNGGHVTR